MQAEELIAAQNTYLEWTGIGPFVLDPDSERLTAAQDGFLVTLTALPDGEEVQGVSKAVEEDLGEAQGSSTDPEFVPDYELPSDEDSRRKATAAVEPVGLLQLAARFSTSKMKLDLIPEL